MADELFRSLAKIAHDGARVHQLRFARERAELLKAKMQGATEQSLRNDGIEDIRFVKWVEDLDYVIAQIKAAEFEP